MTKAATKKAPKAAKTAKAPKKPSTRSQLRAIALRMGHEKGTITAEDLREACRKAGCYNAPNFKQDMKKEAVLFSPIVKDKKTTGWKLTSDGRKIAKELVGQKKTPAKAAAKKPKAPKAAAPKAAATTPAPAPATDAPAAAAN